MYKLLLILLLTFYVNNNAQAQEYPHAPEVVYNITTDGRPYLVFTTPGTGILTQGDTVTIKVFNAPAEVYIYVQGDYIDLSKFAEFNILSPIELSGIKQGGVEYMKINSTKYTFTSSDRNAHAKDARKYLKTKWLNDDYVGSK